MTWVAAAVIGGAALGAGASIYAGQKSADAMESASGQANAISREIYGQQRADQMPYMQSGYQALNAYNRLMGLAPVDTSVTEYSSGGGGLKRTPEMEGKKPVFVDSDGNGYVIAQYGENKGEVYPTGKKYPQYAVKRAPVGSTGNAPKTGNDRYGGFYASPGYQFRMDEGVRAYDRSAAARGRLLSGAQVKAQTRYGQGVASEEFGNFANRLASLAGLGQVANNAVGGYANQYAANAGNAAMNSGMARASGYLGTANTIGSIANNVAASLPYMQSGGGMSATAYDPQGNIVNRTVYGR